MTVKSSISLSDEQHTFAKTLVEIGRYSSVSAVLQQGLDLLRGQIESETLERSALAELLQERRSGAFISGEDMDQRLSLMFIKKRKEHGIQN